MWCQKTVQTPPHFKWLCVCIFTSLLIKSSAISIVLKLFCPCCRIKASLLVNEVLTIRRRPTSTWVCGMCCCADGRSENGLSELLWIHSGWNDMIISCVALLVVMYPVSPAWLCMLAGRFRLARCARNKSDREAFSVRNMSGHISLTH